MNLKIKQNFQMKSGGSKIHPKVKWETVEKCVPYNLQTKRCLLCLNEKNIQRTQSLERKKRNFDKMLTPVEARTSYIWHSELR